MLAYYVIFSAENMERWKGIPQPKTKTCNDICPAPSVSYAYDWFVHYALLTFVHPLVFFPFFWCVPCLTLIGEQIALKIEEKDILWKFWVGINSISSISMSHMLAQQFPKI